MRVRAIDGLPIIDAKRGLTLTINDNDINKASVKEPDDCAVARACRREFHAKEARVHLARVYLRTNKGNWVRYMTPRPLRSEIIAFDRGGKFAPGEFKLLAPNPADKIGAKRKTSPKIAKKSPRRRATHHVVTDVRSGPA